MISGPPRLLLGATLLFWGGMTERAVVGLACALLVEGAHWTRVRWDFGERASLLAWRLSVLFLLIAMVLVLLQGERIHAMGVVFTWLPVILMPLQFVQSYGMSRTISLATFSVMVRRRRDHARKYGLPFREVRFCFDHVYFSAALLASCLGVHANTELFYPGLVILVSWAFIAAKGRGWRGLGMTTVIALTLAAAAGLGGQKGLTALYRYVTNNHHGEGRGGRSDNPREMQTSIGRLGTLKQSPEIRWRLIPEQGELPRLIRVASYSSYVGTTWQAFWLPKDYTEVKKPAEDTGDDKIPVKEADGFGQLAQITNPANPDDPDDVFIVAPPALEDLNVVADPALPRFRLRGKVDPEGGLLPLPANTASLHGFVHVYQDLERSPFGTFRIIPAQPVVDARVLWADPYATELPPWESVDTRRDPPGPAGETPEPDSETPQAMTWPDLEVPPLEAEMIREVVDGIGLREGTLDEKIERLRAHFLRNFTYIRYNQVREDFDRDRDRSLIGNFLTRTRAGHCEFYATAVALLLRETGIPTRYVSGFAVVEFDRDVGEALLRGTHAHAWCRAWDAEAQRWIDVDLTPPAWTTLDTKPQMSRFQGLSDWIQRQREDFLVWRDRPGHIYLVIGGFLLPVLVGLGFIGRNLWHSRSRLDPDNARRGRDAAPEQTPLLTLVKPARRLLGERPPGMPVAPWLTQLSPRLSHPELLAEALNLHHRLRFDPAARDPELAARLQKLVSELRASLAK